MIHLNGIKENRPEIEAVWKTGRCLWTWDYVQVWIRQKAWRTVMLNFCFDSCIDDRRVDFDGGVDNWNSNLLQRFEFRNCFGIRSIFRSLCLQQSIAQSDLTGHEAMRSWGASELGFHGWYHQFAALDHFKSYFYPSKAILFLFLSLFLNYVLSFL